MTHMGKKRLILNVIILGNNCTQITALTVCVLNDSQSATTNQVHPVSTVAVVALLREVGP